MMRTFRRRGFLRFAGMAGLAGALARGRALAAEPGAGGGGKAPAKAQGKPAAGKSSKPNFLIVVADDMGYSDPGCYGGEVDTPVLNNLAANGLRFTQCYSTARCWPSRTCLLTGYYAQQVRMDPPHGRLPKWARVLPHYLKPSGYRCYTSGKWHLRNAPKANRDGGFDRSYVLRDHDHNFNPSKHELDDKPLPPVRPNSGFYTTVADADYMIEFLKQHQAEHAGEPFLAYLAFTSPHFPLQALPQDIAKYKGKYDEGWDLCRKRRWKRMTDMGLINCALSDREEKIIPRWNASEEILRDQIGPGEVSHAVAWDTLNDVQKKFQSIKMSIHAAMVDRNDQEMGRVIDQIKSMGEFDNTVIVFVSDNGASAEQIIRGDRNDKSAEPGSAKSYLCLGPGWSTASNTPFRLHKSWVHEGGIASPLVIHWPKGIKARGKLRHTPCHFIDLAPTLVDLAGGTIEPTWNGLTPPPLPGRSLRDALADDVTIDRPYLYFNHSGHHAIRVGDFKAVTLGGEHPWELYDMRTDRCESDDQAPRKPEKVAEMVELWQKLDKQFHHDAGDDQNKPRKKATRK